MSGFLRRFTEEPTIEVIQQIEGVVVIDLAPPDPVTGAGSGAVLLVGEFEDGYFATDPEIKGALEVFGGDDFGKKFGGFGYTYNSTPAQNPSARRHMSELWNGNGWLKAFKLRAQRIMVARVDTSVGVVSFDPLATLTGNVGPFAVAVGDTLAATTNIGTGSSTAIAATVATRAGASAAFASVVSGDTFGILIDGGVQVNVVLGGGDITAAAVVSRINSALGYTAAVVNTGQADISGRTRGTAGSVRMVEVTSGVLAKIGHTAGTTVGTGNVGNVDAVTVDELITIINGTVALSSIQVAADKDRLGRLRLSNNVAATASSIRVDAGGPLGAKLGFTLSTTVLATSHTGGSIPAGTRVRKASGQEWVTMQTLTIPAAAAGPYVVKVRPALDDGSAIAASASEVNLLVDQVSWATLKVNNAAGLTAALTEPQLDVAYETALQRTLDESGTVREANYLLIARRSDAVVRAGRSNALQATAGGMHARKFVTGDPIGTTTTQIIANVALYRSDRVFYTGKALKVRIPQIAAVGLAGGLGFTSDGVISVRPDGPLTTICAMLPPEEDPGQQTGLIDDFFEVDAGGEVLTMDSYIALKAAGVAVPRADRVSGMVFQSGETSSRESGRTEISRRKMADYLQDTIAAIGAPYCKKLNKQSRRDALRGRVEGFLAGLKSEQNPERARIGLYQLDDSANAGNTAANLARNLYYLDVRANTLGSMKDIIFRTSIGPTAVTTTEL
ncbi:hypothetical protein UFOVP650_57 [uncultured Caudovirales phage]|uniref:Uncharacterized protein n=1 Tax=uncultured Caudovirales phage TaxID=2100421 RepID=A0A6J5NHT8_9CAUD|nr:hypothetical protein UFOVP650_57 [uncultured Caudovirales phage]